MSRQRDPHRVLDEARLQVRVLDHEQLVGPLQQLVDRRAHRALDDLAPSSSALTGALGADEERPAAALVVGRERDELEDPLDVELVEPGLAEALGGALPHEALRARAGVDPVRLDADEPARPRPPRPPRARSARPSPGSGVRSPASPARAGSARRSAPRRGARAGARRCARRCARPGSRRAAPRRSRPARSPPRTAPGSATCGRPSGPGSRSTVQSISAAISFSLPPWLIRIAFWTPRTPARESPSGTSDGAACRSGVRSCRGSSTPPTLPTPSCPKTHSSPGSSCSRATTCARRWRPSHGFAHTLARMRGISTRRVPATSSMINAASTQLAELIDELSVAARLVGDRYDPPLRAVDTLELAQCGRRAARRRARGSSRVTGAVVELDAEAAERASARSRGARSGHGGLERGRADRTRARSSALAPMTPASAPVAARRGPARPRGGGRRAGRSRHVAGASPSTARRSHSPPRVSGTPGQRRRLRRGRARAPRARRVWLRDRRRR